MWIIWRICCNDDFSVRSAKCTNCPYLTQCTDNQKENIKEIFEEEKTKKIDRDSDVI